MTRPDNTECRDTGIYIHIPYCRSKCPYCDFYSLNSTSTADAYTASLIADIKTLTGMKEIIGTPDSFPSADTLYFGGGTPSVIGGERIGKITDAVRESYSLPDGAEITVECNPSTPDIEDFFGICADRGINRISLGMQSAVDSERKALGRTADAERVKYCTQQARKSGIENISLDIMLGIPSQTIESLSQSLDFALSLNVPHISAYILKLEENTFFYRNRNKLNLPDEDSVADMYLFMCDRLEKAGMLHYEISNFCFDNRYSRHNMKYWDSEEYLGFGASAHSFFGGKRFYYPRSLSEYTENPKAVFDCTGYDADEYIMLKLRTCRGVNLDDIKERFSTVPGEKFNSLLAVLDRNGLVVRKDNSFALTDRGMLLSNSVISSLLSKL